MLAPAMKHVFQPSETLEGDGLTRLQPYPQPQLTCNFAAIIIIRKGIGMNLCNIMFMTDPRLMLRLLSWHAEEYMSRMKISPTR